jgi:filamentous hemagglutinin family protein
VIRFTILSFVAVNAFGLPQNPQIHMGQAHFQVEDNSLLAKCANNTEIHWADFDISPNETIEFAFESPNSIAFNRILSDFPSQIFGTIRSNGSVILQNPQGIVFGKDSKIDVGSLIATTFDLINPFQKDSRSFVFAGSGKGKIIIDGTINGNNGSVCIIGRDIAHNGSIRTEKGSIGFIGFGEVKLHLDENSISVATDPHLCLDPIGTITEMSNGMNREMATTSRIISNGDVNAADHLFILSNHIALESGNYITTTGISRMDIGAINDLQSRWLYCGENALFSATTNHPNAPEILFKSDQTVFKGTATSHSLFGLGGNVEISGISLLLYSGMVNTLSAEGFPGNLTFDPLDLTIQATADMSVSAGPTFFPTALGANLTPASIVAALATSNVIITTVGTVGVQTGSITVIDPIVWNTNSALSFIAVGDIRFNASVSNILPGSAPLSAQSNTGSIYLGNAAMTVPVRFGSDLNAVTVLACQGNIELRGSDTTNVAFAVIGNYDTPAMPTVSTGNLTVQAGRDLILQAGTGSGGISRRSFAAITKLGTFQNIIVDSDIFVTVARDLLMDSSGFDECEAYIGHGGALFVGSTVRGNITLNVGRDAILTSRWDGNVLSDTRAYIGSSSVATSHRSIMNINIGRDLIFQGATNGPFPRGLHAYIGGGGSSTLLNYRQQLTLNVVRDFIFDSRNCVLTSIQTTNDGGAVGINPINSIHVGGNLFMLSGNFANSRAQIRQFQSVSSFTNQIWVGGNINCINGSTASSSSILVFPMPSALTNIGTVDVRTGGDILLAGDSTGATLRSNGGVLFISDYGFTAGQLWTPRSASVCGGANIFAGNPLSANSLTIPSDGIGAISVDMARYNASGYNFTTQSGAVLVAPSTLFITYQMQNGSSFVWDSSDESALGLSGDLTIGNVPNSVFVNNSLSGAPFTSNGTNISISGFRNIDIVGPSLTAPSGSIFVSAENDMSLEGASIQALNQVTLVVDNQAPVPNLIGPGGFSMDEFSSIVSGGPLGIFTALRTQNNISPDALFNGSTASSLAPFLFSTEFENTNLEVWCTYFGLPTTTGTLPVRIFYKPCLQLAVEEAMVIVDQFLTDLHPYNEFPGWEMRFTVSSVVDPMDPYQLPYMLRRKILTHLNHPKSWTVSNH